MFNRDISMAVILSEGVTLVRSISSFTVRWKNASFNLIILYRRASDELILLPNTKGHTLEKALPAKTAIPSNNYW